MSETTGPTITIDTMGGNCPVQAEGWIDNVPFYFRSRGGHWSMSVGGVDVIAEPDWYHQEEYGVWPDAGWITELEAFEFIRKAARLYKEQRQ